MRLPGIKRRSPSPQLVTIMTELSRLPCLDGLKPFSAEACTVTVTAVGRAQGDPCTATFGDYLVFPSGF